MKRLAYLLLTLMLFAACTHTSHEPRLVAADSLLQSRPDSALTLLRTMTFSSTADRMYHQLLLADACNKCYDTLPPDSILREVADFYDRHGSANEQLRAHYLLGCAYRDLGEAPQALQCYQDAIDRADTLAADCNYRQLSRVYGQISDIFYMQNLYRDQLRSSQMSIYYAYKGGDTLAALLSYASNAIAYDLLGNADSTIIVSRYAYEHLLKCGHKKEAATSIGMAVTALLKKGEPLKAKRYMNIYESASGFFDCQGNIAKGHEVYYYDKGEYYAAINKLDSAIYYYRKELTEGKDYINQNAGARGLAKVYQKINKPDSAVKYALYSYEMNDSLYAQMATEEVAQMKAMYDYSRQQQIAQLEQKRAEANANKLKTSIFLILLLTLSAYFIIYKERQRRKMTYEKYLSSLDDLQQIDKELKVMKQHESVFGNLIAEKELRVRHLEEIIQQYEAKQGHMMPKEEKRLTSSSQFKKLVVISNLGSTLSEEEWRMTEEIVKEQMPVFWDFIISNKSRITGNEYKVCLLTRLHFKPLSIAHMINLSAASISKIRISLLYKLFGAEGKPSDFDNRITKV